MQQSDEEFTLSDRQYYQASKRIALDVYQNNPKVIEKLTKIHADFERKYPAIVEPAINFTVAVA